MWDFTVLLSKLLNLYGDIDFLFQKEYNLDTVSSFKTKEFQMRNKVFSVLILAVALAVGACDSTSCEQTPTTPSTVPDPTPAPLTPCQALPEACVGREPFDGTTVFVPIHDTTGFLEWQIIAAKPAMNGTYRRDDRLLVSARCVDKGNLLRNIYVEGLVLFDHGYGSGTWGRILEFIRGNPIVQVVVCSEGWFDLQVGTMSNGGSDPLLACCSKIDKIHFKVWTNRTSAPTLTPPDLEYDQHTGLTRLD